MPVQDKNRHSTRFIRHAAGALIAVSFLIGGSSPMTLAAPARSSFEISSSAQNVDWMSPDTATSLDIGMDVMVPTWIPEPFSGIAPGVTAAGGYYQLYWMIPGGSPTFLYIEGTVGGGFPAGSPADLNKQLSVNASVQGWSAIHDLGIPAGSETPIYDQVWWIANGVLYTVSSNNMTGSDTMSVAESLIVLQPPTVPVEEPVIPTEPPYVPPTEPAPVEQEQPVVEDSQAADPITEPVTGDTEPVSEPVVEASTDTDTTSVPDTSDIPSSSTGAADAVGGSQTTGQESGNSGSGNSAPWSPDRYDQNVPSDGTSGPLPPVIGGDGTGGPNDLALPHIWFRP